MFVIKSNKNVN